MIFSNNILKIGWNWLVWKESNSCRKRFKVNWLASNFFEKWDYRVKNDYTTVQTRKSVAKTGINILCHLDYYKYRLKEKKVLKLVIKQKTM